MGENKDLGNKLHTRYIYDSDKKTQIKTKAIIDEILKKYSDKKFLSLAYDDTSKKLIKEFISLKKQPNWSKILNKVLKGLSDLLEREIKEAKTVPEPGSVAKYIIKSIRKLRIYNQTDILKIKKIKKGVFEVDYLSKRMSPKYDPKKLSYYNRFEPWRDTQFIFRLNFNKNLFIWDYINVEKSFHGKKIGTKTVFSIERLARKLGFTRFSVEYPNRAYWIGKLNYDIPYKYRIGSGNYQYTHEGYKEI